VTNRKRAEWLVALFFTAVVIIVFQQILTDMTESGIASGGPYNNAASYPKGIAVIIGILLVTQFILRFVPVFRKKMIANDSEKKKASPSDIKRVVGLLVIFAVYLWALGVLGYYISTPLMIGAIMMLSGIRKPRELVVVSLLISFFLAFVFEFFLKTVLPIGIFRISIPW